MLWSEIGSTPQIERSGMDGSKREVVVSRDLSWPVSLAYDFLDNRVYWADEKLRCIGSTSLDGGNVKVRSARHQLYLAPGTNKIVSKFTEALKKQDRSYRRNRGGGQKKERVRVIDLPLCLDRSCSWPKRQTRSL